MLQLDVSQLDAGDLREFADKSITDISNFELLLKFRSDYSQSKMIRDFVLYLFERNSINVPWKNRFALISDELVNNSIEYGSLPLDKNEIYVQFTHVGTQIAVLLEVRDTGRGVEAKTSAEMEEIRKLKESEGFGGYLGKRGRGLFQLITNLVDELYFRDNPNGGLCVGIRKKLDIV